MDDPEKFGNPSLWKSRSLIWMIVDRSSCDYSTTSDQCPSSWLRARWPSVVLTLMASPNNKTHPRIAVRITELSRDCRRLFGLSHAASSTSFILA